MLDDSKPLFIAVAEQIEDGILDGTYPEDSAVPSTNELAAFLRINPATAGKKGLNRLVDGGILVKRRGDRHVRRAGCLGDPAQPPPRGVHRGIRRPPLLREAAQLDIGPDELVRMITKEASR